MHTATLAAFGVFAAGFICRPLGGIFFGYWGDKFGRASALRFSIFSIALATLLIGLLPTYLSNAHMPLAEALSFQAILLCAMMLLIPFFGWCGDRVGRKKILSTTAVAIVVLALPFFYLLAQSSVFAVLCALGIATILSAAEQGNTLTAASENTLANVRYTSVSFSFNLGNAIFGGTAPLIISLMMEQGHYFHYFLPSYYLIGMALLMLLATLGLKNSQEDAVKTESVLVGELV